ncbi:MAG: autotransporter outer membrane beta-barrel domain-containing protein [Dialister sp.]|nr:autotransporter outer membrane beta-barrel domain-containing protein [Dialister sp.]
MKKETKKLIAAGIVMALSCGAWGSVLAADPNVATKGEDKNVNSIYSDGKIDAGYYGLKATGDASSSTEGKISLTTPKVEIHATGIGIYAYNWGSVIVGNTDTQDVSISGASQGVKLSKGGCAEITGEQVKIANDIKKKPLIEVDNGVNGANRPAQLIVKGKQIELVSAGQVIDVKSKYSASQSCPKASVVLGDDSTELLSIKGTSGIYAGRNSEIIGNAKDINLVVNSTANTKGVQATLEEATVQLTAKNNLRIDVTGAGATAVYNTSDSDTSGKVELAGNDVKIHATANDDMVYGIQSETHSNVKISGNTVEIGTTGGKNGYNGEIGSAALYAKNSNIEVDANKVVINTTNAKEHAFAVYSNWGSDIKLGKDANSEVQISSSSEGTATGVAVASAEGAKPPALEGLKGETSSTPTTVAPDGKVTINGAKIDVSAQGKKARGLYAQDNNKISVGNAGSAIQISAKGEDAVGVLALVHGSVELNGKNAVIKAESRGNLASEGIHVQNTDMTDTAHRATVNVNTENTTIHADSALVAMSNSVLNVNSNLVTNGKNAILTRGNSDVNINMEGKHTTQLNGDIVFNYDKASSGTAIDSNVNVNLNGEGSFWTGNTKAEWNNGNEGKPDADKMKVSHMTLQVENGAQWNPTSVKEVGDNLTSVGSQAVALNSLKLNNGVVNLDSDKLGANSPVKVENISGNGTITTNSLDNKLVIDEKAAGTKLKVEGSGEIGDKILAGKATLEDLAGTVKMKEGDKTASDVVETQDGIIAGKMSAKVGDDGKIVASTIKTAVQQHNQAVSSMANLSLMTWRQENNDMNKRLGEVRASEGSQGVWARMARGQSKYGQQGIKNQYNYYQLGYDSKISDDWILGGAFTYTDGDSSYTNGSGTNKHTGFAVYGSNLRDDGSFIDLIAKYAHMKNDFDVNGGVGSGDYSTNGLSFSAEYGKRFHQESYWIEPQAELTYGRVSSADFTTKNGASVHQDSMDSLVGRLGFSLGKDIKQGNVYVRVSYLYDFQGDTSVTMSKDGAATSFKTDLGGGWWEFGVGTNLDLGHDTHFYLDVETTAGGDVDTPWQWNAGVRYSF